jgi:F-type H+-transporting ATPase subunit epsilon
MNTFTLQLRSTTESGDIPGVRAFIGEDASGSFGLLAGHARFITVLSFGLARFQRHNEPWQYLALPGAVLSFNANVLSIVTRRYLKDDDYARISTALQAQLLSEEENLRSMKESLRSMEDAMLKRLWQLRRDER